METKELQLEMAKNERNRLNRGFTRFRFARFEAKKRTEPYNFRTDKPVEVPNRTVLNGLNRGLKVTIRMLEELLANFVLCWFY